MGRTKNAKNLTDKQRADFDRKRKKVINDLPYNYCNLVEFYCDIKDIEQIERKKIYNFVAGITYSEEVLKLLTDFNLFMKNKSVENQVVVK